MRGISGSILAETQILAIYSYIPSTVVVQADLNIGISKWLAFKLIPSSNTIICSETHCLIPSSEVGKLYTDSNLEDMSPEEYCSCLLAIFGMDGSRSSSNYSLEGRWFITGMSLSNPLPFVLDSSGF